MKSRDARTIQLSDLPAGVGELIDEISPSESHVVIERDGNPVAVIVPIRRAPSGDFSALFSSQRRFEDVSETEIEKEVARALAEVRAESRD